MWVWDGCVEGGRVKKTCKERKKWEEKIHKKMHNLWIQKMFLFKKAKTKIDRCAFNSLFEKMSYSENEYLG